MSVQGVVTRDTGRDLTEMLNAAGERYGFDPVGLLAGAIAESNLDEHSVRNGVWPDVSFGLYHPAVKWIGPEAEPLNRAADGTALDTVANRMRVRDLSWDAEWAINYVAPRYAKLLERWGDPLEAWSRYNKPAIPGELNPNRANYVRALARAEEYRTVSYPDDGVHASNEIKEKLHAIGTYASAASRFVPVGEGLPEAEQVLTPKGYYVSSPVDGWGLTGPFGAAE